MATMAYSTTRPSIRSADTRSESRTKQAGVMKQYHHYHFMNNLQSRLLRGTGFSKYPPAEPGALVESRSKRRFAALRGRNLFAA
ncbi:MAG: hypothetical protein H6851_03680 [Geminicoccaceae bacterium]|nr:hypothetical protein [Geminicoccaceae bacterium]